MNDIEKEARQSLMDGVIKAKEDTGRASLAAINFKSSLGVIEDRQRQSFDLLEETIVKALETKLAEAAEGTDAILIVRGIFESLRHRLRVISKSVLAKSLNFGYTLAIAKYGETEVFPVYETGGCTTCLENSQQSISLGASSSLDEVAIYDRIPPWHPGCECGLESTREGR